MTTPEVQILSDSGSDLSALIPNIVETHNAIEQRKNLFALLETNVSNSLTFHGTGFTYNGDAPTGGQVTSITLVLGNENHARIENLSFGLVKLFNLINAGNIDKLFNLFGDTGYTGNAGEDVIKTGNGDDRLDGRAGNDTLIGGGGGDELTGGKGIDTASYFNAGRGVVASLFDSTGNTHDADGDTYGGVENVTGSDFNDVLTGTNQNNALDGGEGDDRLFGLDGVDKLHGGDGRDFLAGGKSSDSMYGGLGADQFFFKRPELGHSEPDRIEDWGNNDLVVIDAASFGHGLVPGEALSNGQFHLDAAVGAQAQFFYTTAEGNLWWDANGDANGGAVIVCEIVGAPAFGKADIIVI